MPKGEFKFIFRDKTSGIVDVFDDDMNKIAKYSWKIENDEVVVSLINGNIEFIEEIEDALNTYYDVLNGSMVW